MNSDLLDRINRATLADDSPDLPSGAGMESGFDGMRAAIGVTVAHAVIVFGLLWPLGFQQALVVWLGTGMLIGAMQLLLTEVYRRSGDAERRTRTLQTLLIGSIGASGLYWGFAGGWFFPDASPLHQALLAALLALLCAATVTLYSSIRGAGWLFAIPALAPMMVRLALNDIWVYGLLCLAILISVTSIIRMSARNRRALGESRALRVRNAELAYHATHDPLVDLPNPREFKRRLDAVALQAERAGSQYALIYVDLDDFKLINDQYGHAAGDELLIATARALQSMVRSTDTAGRIGGDEFVVLLADCPQDQAVRIAEACRVAIHERLRLRSIADHAKLSASIGVAYSMHGSYSGKGMIRAADTACYAAKESGKNAVAVRAAGTDYEETGRFELRALVGGDAPS
jgi:diguanylate cyclase (GGDEF)-like protein